MNLIKSIYAITPTESGSETKSNILQGPGFNPGTGTESVTTLENIISKVIGVLTVIATIYFVIQIILAGYAIISSAGDPKNTDSAKRRLTFSVMGLAIVVAAYGLGALITGLLGIDDVFNLSNIIN